MSCRESIATLYCKYKSTSCVLCLITGLCFASPAPAQSEPEFPYENDASTLRSVMAPELNANEVKTQLQALLESTRKARRDRDRRSQAGSPPNAMRNTVAETRTPTASAVGAETTNSETGSTTTLPEKLNSARSIDEIRERIRILQRLRRDRMMMDQTAQEQAVANPTAPVMPMVPLNEEAEKARLEEQVSPSLEAADAGRKDATGVPASTPGSSVKGSQVLPQPANAFALGQSLYRTGNYESALKSFRAAEARALSPSERTWLDLLIALCEHRLGRTSEAMGLLREVANTKSTDYPIQVSQWWLQHAEASNETRMKWDALSSELKLLAERVNEQ